MSDLRTLLLQAAPRPDGPLDMHAVRARAERRSVRRGIIWLASIGAVLGLGIPAGNSVLAPAGSGSGIRIVEPDLDGSAALPGPTVAASPTTVVAPLPGRTARDVQAAVPDAFPTTTTTETGPASPTGRAAAARATATTTGVVEEEVLPQESFAPSDWCSVNNDGLDDGQTRRCGFVATKSGGWNFYQPPAHLPVAGDVPVARVTVWRDGKSTTFSTRKDYGPSGSWTFKGCDDRIIESGDTVVVTIVQSRDKNYPPQPMGVGAGDGWGCANPRDDGSVAYS